MAHDTTWPKTPAPSVHSSGDFAADRTPMQALAPQRGATFRSQLNELASGTRSAALLSATLPVAYSNPSRTQLSKSTEQSINYSYTRSTHASTASQTEWTQGLMTPAVGTEWKNVLPEDLSLEKATLTTRAVKAIMDHRPKPTELPKITTISGVNVMVKSGIIPAPLSFVEDVTGELAAATRHTGSAIRAAYLSAKLQMKNTGASNFTGFRERVMGALSQLKSGGAAELARTISAERQASADGKTSATAGAYQSKTAGLHDLAEAQIDTRFTAKHSQYMTLISDPAKVRAQLGDWWADADRRDANTARSAYSAHKFSKHGIL